MIVTEPVVINFPPTATPTQNVSALATFLINIAVVVGLPIIISALPIVVIVVLALLLWRAWKKRKKPV